MIEKKNQKTLEKQTQNYQNAYLMNQIKEVQIVNQSQQHKFQDLNQESNGISNQLYCDQKSQKASIDQDIQQIREYLIYIIERRVVFPQILSYVIISKDKICINYCDALQKQLNRIYNKLEKDKSSSEEIITNSDINKLDNDEKIILKLLQYFTNKLADDGMKRFNLHHLDLQNIRIQYNLCRQIKNLVIQNSKVLKLIIQQIKIVHSDLLAMEANQQQISSDESQPEQNRQKQQTEEQIEQLTKFDQNKDKIQLKNKQLQLDQSFYEENDQSEKENKIRKEFAIKVLMLKLVDLQIVVPHLLKLIKFIYFSKRHKIPDKRGILIIYPSEQIILQLCKIPELVKFAQQFKLEQILCSFMNPNSLDKFQLEYPNYLKVDLHAVLISYLQLIINNYFKYKEELIQIYYRDEQFKMLLKQIWQLCGENIKQILCSKLDPSEQFRNFGCNILQVGTYLFKIKSLIEQNIDQKEQLKIDEDPCQFQLIKKPKKTSEKVSTNTKPIFKQFIQKMTMLNKSFPLLLKLLHLTNFTIKVIPRKRVMEAIVQQKQFIKFMKICYNYPLEIESIADRVQTIFFSEKFQIQEVHHVTWPQLILMALELIYQQREQNKQLINEAVQSKQYQLILRELETIEDPLELRQKTKELLFLLNDYVKELKNES
ncbi:unnamed protein product [Paramecium sonneborni]|uniref:Uncharacterized protein n=1 Tax=Paramecium sonneborni TaxID=65129 RepID=A0A8S1K9S4_9CILI|nr:unnamed protein product [Paramecium sonneborni]